MRICLSVALTFLLNCHLAAQPVNIGILSFNATGFSNDKGSAQILLYRNGDKIPDGPFKTAVSSIKNKTATISLTGIPYGYYAAILLHDENNNNKIDHSFGLPSEQLGYTNHWTLGFFTGMPTFTKLKFAFSPTATIQEIHITYKKK